MTEKNGTDIYKKNSTLRKVQVECNQTKQNEDFLNLTCHFKENVVKAIKLFGR